VLRRSKVQLVSLLGICVSLYAYNVEAQLENPLYGPLLFATCYQMHAVCCLLSAVCCLLSGVYCLLSDVALCYLLSAVCSAAFLHFCCLISSFSYTVAALPEQCNPALSDLCCQLSMSPFISCTAIFSLFTSPAVWILFHRQPPSQYRPPVLSSLSHH
jgi:hypothetical protein